MTVVWSRRAEEKLRHALVQGGQQDRLALELAELSTRLERAFPPGHTLVLLNYFRGFNFRPHEHILKADLRVGEQSNTIVIKIASHEKLDLEQQNWNRCHITDTDPILMPLRPYYDPDQPGQLLAIAYQDADSHIGAEEIVWLEQAVSRCVRFNAPELGSVLKTVVDLYATLRNRLHCTGRLDPASDCVRTMPKSEEPERCYPLKLSLDKWIEPNPLSIRWRVNGAFRVGCLDFLDPVDYFRHLDTQLARKETSGVPALTRGLAHGDLHGRNSMVGIEHELAKFPTLFDYGNVTANNLIAWDFVELEMELKNRILESIFPKHEYPEKIRLIQQFEYELAEQTFSANESGRWSIPTESAEAPIERLRQILLTIRHEAMMTLCRLKPRSLDCLHEYFFVLGCYGVHAVRYKNQTEVQLMVGYISAGVATAMLERHWPQKAVPAANANELVQSFATYQTPLKTLREWNRGGRETQLSAHDVLNQLAQQYPASLHVHFELAYNLVKLERVAEAQGKLKATDAQFDGHLDEDTFSLMGRLHKDLGTRELTRGLQSPQNSAVRQSCFREAIEALEKASDEYGRAYHLEHGFFSGINLATLRFLLAGLRKSLGQSDASAKELALAKHLANELRSGSQHWKDLLPDDAFWRRATEAEAALLLNDVPYAAERYQKAFHHQANNQQSYAGIVGKQIERILSGYELLGISIDIAPLRDISELAHVLPII